MKKIFLIISGLAIVASLTTSCKDDSYTDLYDNPNQTSIVGCDKLMTGVFMQARDYTYNSYWRMYTWENIFAKYAQTVGYNNESGSVYYAAPSYINDRWKNFYLTLSQYRNLEKLYNGENEDTQQNDILYKDIAEVFVLDHLSQCLDLFGDMPYFDASKLGVNGCNIVEAMPKYDDDKDLYKHVIERLGEFHKTWTSRTLTAQQAKTFTAQDFICKGNIEKWIAYANSIRLRTAIHVAAHGDLVADAKAAIKECMTRPLIEDDNDNVELYADMDGFKYWEDFNNGFKDINNVASQPMIDNMTITVMQDPRLAVMYIVNSEGNYIGKGRNEEAAFQTTHSSSWNEGGQLTYDNRYYSYLTPTTFCANNYFISPIITAAEVHFLKAEAYQEGYVSGDAYSEFQEGLIASTKFYYRQNNHEYNGTKHVSTQEIAIPGPSISEQTLSYPGDDVVKNYASLVWNAYTEPLEAIITMKWIHFGAIQPTQAWTDYRRTGYPVLSTPTDSQQQNAKYKNLPNRVVWPETEVASNTANYEAACKEQANDPSTKLFWAK